MATAWKLAGENIKGAQVHQKKSYDKKSREVDLKVGERVMVFMPSDCKGKERKLARPFHGPYRVVAVSSKYNWLIVLTVRVSVCHWTELEGATQNKEIRYGQDLEVAERSLTSDIDC